MADTAFQNVDDDAVRAAREATLEAYRQSLIAYDANPVPVSSDLDDDTDNDGLYWDSAVGAWVSTGGGGNGSSLPPLWTTDDVTSEITGTSVATTVPLTLTASDENSAVLSLFPAPGGSYLATPLVEFYDDTGTKIGDFDASGLLALYDIPNFTNIYLWKEGAIHIIYDDDTARDPLFRIGTQTRSIFQITASGTGSSVVIPGVDPGDILFQVQAANGQTADIVQLWDLNYDGNTRFDKDARLVTRVHSAPADGEIAAGDCAMWFDQTNGAAKAMFKGKSADGTVVVGNVALS